MLHLHFLESLSRKYHEFGKATAPRSKLGKKAYKLMSYFSLRERAVFYVFLLIFIGTSVLIVDKLNDMVTVEVPIQGGSLSEAILGIPRFVNPVLAVGDADKDVSALIYSGLMRVGPSGELIPDLAESYAVSEDGLTYTFTLRKNARFHDGIPVKSSDVGYTIRQIQNPTFKSPREPAWQGVTYETPDSRTIVFRLKTAYALFLENTTVGILPEHTWKETNEQTFPYHAYNLTGIGSGPYRVVQLEKDADGIPKRMELTSFKGFTLGTPYIQSLSLSFFPNEDEMLSAVRSGRVGAVSGLSAETLKDVQVKNRSIVPFYLPRVFGVFFNQNQVPAFSYPEVRRALDAALDKERITQSVLGEYGTVATGPIPPGSFGYQAQETAQTTGEAKLESAKALLIQNGWKQEGGIFQKVFTDAKKNTRAVRLSFSLATAATPELKHAAELVQDTWKKLGAEVSVKVYEVGDINQNIIRPRRFDALFFGEIVGRNPDPYFFWNSAERSGTGLNIAQYTNPAADKLTVAIRGSVSEEDRKKKLSELTRIIVNDTPVSFIYAPRFIYILPTQVRGVTPISLTTPDERFSNIYMWYIDTERVWKIFNSK